MADLISPDAGDITRDVPRHSVWTRTQWGDDWTAQPSLFVDGVFWGSGLQPSSAQLWWSYGKEIKPGGTAFQTYTKKDLLGQYVKIEIRQPDGNWLYWYGVITDVQDKLGGALLDGGVRTATGEQVVQARGLDYLLQRAFVETSIVRNHSTGVTTTHRRGLTFNAENRYANTGNRSTAKDANGVYAFSNDLDNADYWTTKDILEYLLRYYSPRDIDRTFWLGWSLNPNTEVLAPTWDQPVVATDGRDLRSIISQLLDPRRLLSWSISVEAPEADPNANKTVYLDLFSFNERALLLPSGGIQEANVSIVSLDFDRALDVRATLRNSEVHKVEQVIVRGAHKRAIVSFAYLDATLEKDWQDADETAYETGPAGIGGLDIDKQRARLEGFRAGEQCERVYTHFRLPSTWDGRVGNGVGGALQRFFPDDSDYGEETVYIPQLRFLRELPGEVQNFVPSGSPLQDLRPFAVIKLEDDGSSTDRFQYVDQLSSHAGVEGYGEGNGRQWACSLRMQSDGPGIIVRVNGGPDGMGPHGIAALDFAASATGDKAGELDWQDLIATVMIELDARNLIKYPAAPVRRDVGRIVYIDVPDERGRLDYMGTNTVTGIDDGELQYLGAESYIRDDRTYMRDLAYFIYEWYGTKRQAFSFGLKQVYGGLSVGDLITSIGAAETLETVNSAVTGVRIDMRSATTQITTMYPALDFKNL